LEGYPPPAFQITARTPGGVTLISCEAPMFSSPDGVRVVGPDNLVDIKSIKFSNKALIDSSSTGGSTTSSTSGSSTSSTSSTTSSTTSGSATSSTSGTTSSTTTSTTSSTTTSINDGTKRFDMSKGVQDVSGTSSRYYEVCTTGNNNQSLASDMTISIERCSGYTILYACEDAEGGNHCVGGTYIYMYICAKGIFIYISYNYHLIFMFMVIIVFMPFL
jgi:hypothetical protein